MAMTATLVELLSYLEKLSPNTEVKIDGDHDHCLEKVASIHAADVNSITFFSDDRLREQLNQCQAGAVILHPRNCDAFAGNKLVVANPLLAFAQIAERFNAGPVMDAGVHHSAVVDESVSMDDGVSIAANVVIGANTHLGTDVVVGAGTTIGRNCRIGSGTTLDPRVTIYDDCQLGQRCRISAGAVIGGSGFGYVQDGHRWRPVPQLAGVRIGSDVDIGANTTVDCGALDDTVIEDHVKIDDQVHIAHNCFIGAYTIIAGFSGIAGSSRIGKRCMLGGRVSVMDHVVVTDDVIVEGTSFISKSVSKPGLYSSIVTAQEAGVWKRNSARLHRLDGMAKRLRALEKKFEE